MSYFSLNFYPIHFKPLHCDPYVLGYVVMIFFKNSQLLFRLYSGFFETLCMDRCRLNDVHVG